MLFFELTYAKRMKEKDKGSCYRFNTAPGIRRRASGRKIKVEKII
jgi:hypothetical protein